MTGRRPPWERLVDLAVFAPIGIMVTVQADLPRYIRQGRQVFENRIVLARWLGEMAVQQGRREIAKHLSPSSSTAGPPAAETSVDTAIETDAVEVDAADIDLIDTELIDTELIDDLIDTELVDSDAPRPGDAAVEDTSTDVAAEVAELLDVPPVATAPEPPEDAGEAADEPARVDAAELPIEGYESLAALHVVQRLAGLSAAELDAVRRFEESHRSRRTILAKIAQLQGERR